MESPLRLSAFRPQLPKQQNSLTIRPDFGVGQVWAVEGQAMKSLLDRFPLSYSISDGIALGFIAYPAIKLFSGRGREVNWLMYVIGLLLVAYFVTVRSSIG